SAEPPPQGAGVAALASRAAGSVPPLNSSRTRSFPGSNPELAQVSPIFCSGRPRAIARARPTLAGFRRHIMFRPSSLTCALVVLTGIASAQQVFRERQVKAPTGAATEVRRGSQILGSTVQLQNQAAHWRI